MLIFFICLVIVHNSAQSESNSTYSQNWSLCDNGPCLNGGICTQLSPEHKFTCMCPQQFTGPTCEVDLTCSQYTCGPNAQCFISNQQINCVCKAGYAGNDPKNEGCHQKSVTACVRGSDHYTTFDGLHYEYRGACPFAFSQPCSNLSGGYDNFRLVVRNELFGFSSFSAIQVEATMLGHKFNINRKSGKAYVNGLATKLPYYYPSKMNPEIKMYLTSNTYHVINLIDLVMVTFTTGGTVCIQIPDVPEMKGRNTLCGLAGNYDGNWKNDIKGSNGIVWPISTKHVPTTSNDQQRVLDTWITEDFLQLGPDQKNCSKGELLVNNTNCDTTEAKKSCAPILLSSIVTEQFGKCAAMGSSFIQEFYSNCVHDVCNGYEICDILANFAQSCMNNLPNTHLSNWRDITNCPLVCQPNSHYSSCSSSCPATCSSHSKPDFCDKPFYEGCTCDEGYVLDNSNTLQVTCIEAKDCGCNDSFGNYHSPNQPWVSHKCTALNECINGTFSSQIHGCSQYAECSIDEHGKMGCKCRPGFTGNGMYCEDINECLDQNTCSQEKGHRTCTNTIGSHECSCETYHDGPDCQCYHPRRHCADLYKFWKNTTSGVYTINPPYPFAGKAAFNNHQVYCDMETSGGGWTLMSHDSGSGMANKTFKDYVAGFGNVSKQNVWLGLDVIHGMTNDVETSLMVALEKCPRRRDQKKTTNCVYPTFRVDGSDRNYTVTIPEACTGMEEGWARWNLTRKGPQFSAYDHDNASCSARSINTGWWFDTQDECGAANLNGVRYSCRNPPIGPQRSTYLYWSGSPMGDGWMYLRPKNYPDYDNHPISC